MGDKETSSSTRIRQREDGTAEQQPNLLVELYLPMSADTCNSKVWQIRSRATGDKETSSGTRVRQHRARTVEQAESVRKQSRN
jgi:hypothetical protein